MTEAEWRECADPVRMLQFLRGRASDRKDRLFLCACARRVWHLLTPAERQQVDASEGYADGLIGREDLLGKPGTPDLLYPEVQRTTILDFSDALAAFIRLAEEGKGSPQAVKAAARAEEAAQSALVRDVFGNPFRTAHLPPSVLAGQDGAAVRLAGAIYDGRRFGELPILADALEEAGCTDAELLNHLRSPRVHVLGCWALDVVLGQS
jgi:hypothetical protein